MSGINARIRIKHDEGADIAYINEIETLRDLGIDVDDFDPSQTYFNEGTEFTFDETVYRIVKINTRFLADTVRIDERYGINMYGVDENQPFNFEITVRVIRV